MTTTALRRWAGGLLAVSVIGCGLSDYEDLMRTSQANVARFADESQNLGDPIAIPTRRKPPKDAPPPPPPGKNKDPKAAAKDPKAAAKDKAAPKEQPKEEREPVIAYPVFLRLPLGIRTTPELEPRPDPAYLYPRAGAPTPRPGSATDPGAADLPGGTVSGFAGVYVAFSGEPAGVFVDKVARLFPHNADPVVPKRVDINVPGRQQPITYDVREFNDALTHWAVYAHSEGASTVAIVYRMEKAQKDALAHQIELSAGSLAIGGEANSVAASYARRPK